VDPVLQAAPSAAGAMQVPVPVVTLHRELPLQKG
jgi:hypothetical protein